MNFICAGEMPLSIEAATDNYLEIDLKSKAALNTFVTTVFATGAAAKNLNNKINPAADEAFNFYRTLFQAKSDQNPDTICCNQDQALQLPESDLPFEQILLLQDISCY